MEVLKSMTMKKELLITASLCNETMCSMWNTISLHNGSCLSGML